MSELEIHPAFVDAGKNVGMEVWRIEQFEPVKKDAKEHGTFYSGDAYLVLHTTKSSGSKLQYDLHFWLGKNCAQDEAGSAAIRTVELDNMCLNGAAVQYREVQGHESKTFLSYYKSGIRYLEGGVDSGFKPIDDGVYVNRLFQVKGRKNIRVEQVECVCGSLNQGDTFILDADSDIFVWVGPKSENKERLAGVEGARLLRDEEKAGRAVIHIVEEDWETNEAFFKTLGTKDSVIKAADDLDDDDIVRKLDQSILLYQVSPGDGDNFDTKEITQRPLKQDYLDSKFCYLLDSGATGIFLWTGVDSELEFRARVWDAANIFLDKRGYPAWMSITRVVDGGETPLFKQYFENWTDRHQKEEEEEGSNVAGTATTSRVFMTYMYVTPDQDYSGADGIDVGDLHKKKHEKAEEWMPDEGDGKLEVDSSAIHLRQMQTSPSQAWKVHELELLALPKEAHGVFFAEDCYIFLYTYGVEDNEQFIIYFWQGSGASVEDKTACAGLVVSMDNKLGGRAVQMRVVMNKEPKHFMKLFNGKIVVFSEGHITGFKSLHDRENFDAETAYLFQIRGTSETETKAVQVPARAASLNSNDMFVLDTAKKAYGWAGQYCTEQEREMAQQMGQFLAEYKECVAMKEGEETQQFWNAIGGEEEYYTGQRVTQGKLQIDPRLFHCSMTSGKFTVEEIVDFHQDDLEESDVMLLDTYDEIFVWVGADCREFERKETAKTAYNYLASDPTGRTPDNTMIVVVQMGFEPPQFTGCFLGWNPDKWADGKSFHDLIADVGKENAGISLLKDEVKKYTSFYPLEQLQEHLPPVGVDVTKKEMYLSDEDFLEVFGMSKEKFLEFPEWKRINMRKEHDLF
ncbi:hypothetical protein CAPTEDRAFT_170352 [Capitella teleta]|uniref:HP domain-containing protein n=1 Tax=Capitella teleta TaxID=283909 RepID=R7UAU9_CAPTE|nr:hypothetical protein CAPTEDRAFT_170352 [Capitella teleta]|eukprot:ELU00392.1 hypothetical protein CAPTEDRAFT_170352 [Capitella teleta]